MSDEPVNLREVRALKNEDAKLWTPLDALKATVREIESGRMHIDGVYIAMVRKEPDGEAKSFPFATAGLTVLESRGMLQQHLHEMCASFTASTK